MRLSSPSSSSLLCITIDRELSSIKLKEKWLHSCKPTVKNLMNKWNRNGLNSIHILQHYESFPSHLIVVRCRFGVRIHWIRSLALFHSSSFVTFHLFTHGCILQCKQTHFYSLQNVNSLTKAFSALKIVSNLLWSERAIGRVWAHAYEQVNVWQQLWYWHCCSVCCGYRCCC